MGLIFFKYVIYYATPYFCNYVASKTRRVFVHVQRRFYCLSMIYLKIFNLYLFAKWKSQTNLFKKRHNKEGNIILDVIISLIKQVTRGRKMCYKQPSWNFNESPRASWAQLKWIAHTSQTLTHIFSHKNNRLQFVETVKP